MVSIVIPTYEQYGRGAGFLRLLLHSLLIQKSPYYFEVCISDNSKDDSILEVVNEFEGALDIRYAKNDASFGVSNNANAALDLSQYDLIKPIFQDDVLLDSSAIKKFIDGLTGSFWVASKSIWINEKNEKIRDFEARFPAKAEDLLTKGNSLGMPSVVAFRRSEVRFSPELMTEMDTFFYLQMFREHGAPRILPDYLVGQRISKYTNSLAVPNRREAELTWLKAKKLL